MPLFFQIAHAVSISAGIPGTNPTTAAGTSPGAWVANFYQFALLIGGILAFGAIVYGGVLHAVSAGNPSRQSEGKQWIWSALIGLLLLGGAYIILNTVNPNLINLSLPTLTPITTQNSNTSGGCSPATCNGTCYAGTCYAAGSCQAKGMCVDSSGNCVACASNNNNTGATPQSCTAQNLCWSILSKTCVPCQ